MAGLANLSEFFENPLFSKAIREVPVETGYIGQRFLPLEETFDIDFNETVIERQADMADIIDSGAELPLTDRDPVRRISGEITDMGQSYIVTKKELAAMMDKGNAAKQTMMVKQLLNKTAQLKRNIDARIEWLRWQALGVGAMAYDKSGIKLGVDFGVPAGNKVVAANKWNATGATILANYEKWVQDYVDLNTNGYTPDVFVTSIEAIRNVLNDTSIRKSITGFSDKLLTLEELNTFLRGRDLPPMEAFDAKVTYRDVTSGGTRTTARLLAREKGVFLKEGGLIGKQLLGPTYENDMNPGIYARTFTMERPIREVIEVVGASFPKVMDPDLIKIATIL
ncbi:MAG: major capsid protein [Hydrogenoanaerobacterium sp.]